VSAENRFYMIFTLHRGEGFRFFSFYNSFTLHGGCGLAKFEVQIHFFRPRIQINITIWFYIELKSCPLKSRKSVRRLRRKNECLLVSWKLCSVLSMKSEDYIIVIFSYSCNFY
jgi:hypothetical protein